MKKVRFGIVGIGNMGGNHADRIFNAKDELFELTAVCDVNPKSMRRCKQDCLMQN